ncbi:prepilin-type N-terminal cleavage/methylation domain-containing protein [Haloimpatiens sp. FM7330]|uniref:prepilin-type N-terminal cleavage/methylation domain-containing protein n=1 Tax=Haloimpatiens sp. FM7330 TaxID=3298610 RepID=UPI003630BD70
MKKIYKKGMTLIEVIISLAILCIIIIPILSLCLNNVKINKSSEDKSKAKNIAQQYMEYVKSPNNSIDDIKKLSHEKDGFTIDTTIEPVEDYKFSEYINSEDIQCNIKIQVDEQNNLKIYDKSGEVVSNLGSLLNLISIHVNDSGNNIIVKNKDADTESNISINVAENKDVKIKIELIGDINFKIDAVNECEDKNLILYFIKFNRNSNYSINSTIGKIKFFSSIDENLKNGDMNYRLYKVKVKVSKNGEVLQIIEGYKTFQNS